MAAKENPFFAARWSTATGSTSSAAAWSIPKTTCARRTRATNPELLDALAKHFVGHGFDLKDLVRTICRSTTYQLTAEPNEYNQDDKQNFSRYYPKRLNAEVLLDAIDQVTGTQTNFTGLPVGTRAVQLAGQRLQFVLPHGVRRSSPYFSARSRISS